MDSKRFCYLIGFIKESKAKEEKFCDALCVLSPGTYADVFLYSEYESELIKTIKDAMSIPEEDETIEYFMYDLEFGDKYKPGTFTENGVDIDLSSTLKLYEYLSKKVSDAK